VNRITAWLRLRDRARFSKDANKAARDIREIGRAADETGGPQGPLQKLGAALAQFGEASSSLTPRTRIFGFAIGTVATAAIGAIPLIVGLAGAATAVVASFASAAIGAGLLAGALTAVLGAGLGSVGLVAFNFAQNFQDVNERFTTYRNAVASFGRDSQQAETAFKRLNGVIKESGGPLVYQAVRAWYELRNEFTQGVAPAMQKVWGFAIRLIDAIRPMIPLFARLTGQAVDALIPVLEKWVALLGSPEIRRGLQAIFDGFSRIAGPIGMGVQNIFLGLFRLTVRMLPFLGRIADGFEIISAAFLRWASDADLSPFLASLQSWWDLLKAIGGLMVTVFTGGAAQGDSLVQSLTGVINKWNDFLSTTEGRGEMRQFFTDAVSMTKAFANVLGGFFGFLFNFGRTLMPLYTQVFGVISDAVGQFFAALAPAKPFWDNVLGPLLKGLAIGVGGTLVGAFKVITGVIRIFATALGWLGKHAEDDKGTFETLGKIIGFFLGGPILKALGSIGKLNIVLRPLGFLFRALYAPIQLVGSALGWVLTRIGSLSGAILGFAGRILPFLRTAWNRVLGWLTGAGIGGRLFDAGIKLWNKLRQGFLQAIGSGLGFAGDIGKAIWNFIAGNFNRALPDHIGPINLPDNPLPMLAAGGVVSGQGSWITGEQGPELNTLRGGRVTVEPLPAVQAQSTSATLEPGGGRRVLVSKVYLRGRQIAEAVADEAEDDEARR
jgi:hypothetical protein